MPNIDEREIRFAILEIMTTVRNGQCRNNIIRADGGGFLTSFFQNKGKSFDSEDTSLAYSAWNDLVRSGHLIFHHTDTMTDWYVVSESGLEALQRGDLDNLDEALRFISPSLVEIRAGAWAAVDAGLTDGGRQVATSVRELINQTLKEGAPEERETRRDRYNFIAEKVHGRVSKSQRKVFEKGCDYLLELVDSLNNRTHNREVVTVSEVRGAIKIAEHLLSELLIPKAS